MALRGYPPPYKWQGTAPKNPIQASQRTDGTLTAPELAALTHLPVRVRVGRRFYAVGLPKALVS